MKKSFIIPNNTLNHAPFCTVCGFLHLFQSLSLSNACSMQQQSPNWNYMAASDVMLKVVLKCQRVTRCEVRLDGNVDERIDHAETSVRLPDLENEKSILQFMQFFLIKNIYSFSQVEA
jgi:hypothetical protein